MKTAFFILIALLAVDLMAALVVSILAGKKKES